MKYNCQANPSVHSQHCLFPTTTNRTKNNFDKKPPSTQPGVFSSLSDDFCIQQGLRKIKQPYLQSIESSKLRLQNRFDSFYQETEELQKYEELIVGMVKELLRIKEQSQESEKLNERSLSTKEKNRTQQQSESEEADVEQGQDQQIIEDSDCPQEGLNSAQIQDLGKNVQHSKAKIAVSNQKSITTSKPMDSNANSNKCVEKGCFQEWKYRNSYKENQGIENARLLETEISGGQKKRLFKNSHQMNQQYCKIFNKQAPLTKSKVADSESCKKQQQRSSSKVYGRGYSGCEGKENPNTAEGQRYQEGKIIKGIKQLQKELLEKLFEEYSVVNRRSENNPNDAPHNHHSPEETISFEAVYNFLNKYELFFTAYDIEPSEIVDLVSTSAHIYPNKLTKAQFLSIFLTYDTTERRLQDVQLTAGTNLRQLNCQGSGYKGSRSGVLTNCLSEGQMKELKDIFDTLDVFGQNLVDVRAFVHRMKTSKDCRELYMSNVVGFPSIDRHYTFKKVLFEMENKRIQSYGNMQMSWQQLQDEVFAQFYYSQIKKPKTFVRYKDTGNSERIHEELNVYQISLRQIQNAKIEKDTTAFILTQDVVQILVDEFQRCPKFCGIFVKNKYFCEEILTSESLRTYLKSAVRETADSITTVDANIKLLQRYAEEYYDLDEMLEYFSVRGFEKQLQKQRTQKIFNQNEEMLEDEKFESLKAQRAREKRMKSLDGMNRILMKSGDEGVRVGKDRQSDSRTLCRLQNNPIEMSQISTQQNRHFSRSKATVVEQFALTKKRSQPTIRERKLKEQLQEKQEKELKELKPFVKANPIPAASTYKRFQKQQRKFKAQCEQNQYRRAVQRQEDSRKIDYLKANTKIFEFEKNSGPTADLMSGSIMLKEESPRVFEAKPISWFVKQEGLLKEIEGQKEERRKNRLRETKQKYVYGYWKKMPYDETYKVNINKVSINGQLDLNQKLDRNNCDDSLEQINDCNQSLQNSILQNATHEAKKAHGNSALKDSSGIKASPVPDFKRLHQQFQRQLQEKKRVKSPTVVRQFNLTQRQRKQHNSQNQSIISAEKESRHCQSPRKKQLEQSKIIRNSQQRKSCDITHQRQVKVQTTKKFEDMVRMNQMKQQQRLIEDIKKQQEQIERKEKKKAFGKFMKKVLKQENKKFKNVQKQLATKCSSKRKTLKKKIKEEEMKHQQDLKKIYRKVLSQPFMFQEANGKKNSTKAKKVETIPMKRGKTSRDSQKRLESDFKGYNDGTFASDQKVKRVKIPRDQNSSSESQFNWYEQGEEYAAQENQFFQEQNQGEAEEFDIQEGQVDTNEKSTVRNFDRLNDSNDFGKQTANLSF